MNLLVIISGTLIGLGVFVAVILIMPARPRLDAALARIGGAPGIDLDLMSMRTLGRQVGSVPWLPVPAADLALLGQDHEQWLTQQGHLRADRSRASSRSLRRCCSLPDTTSRWRCRGSRRSHSASACSSHPTSWSG